MKSNIEEYKERIKENPDELCNVKFTIEAGGFFKSSLRNALYKMKNDLSFKYQDSKIEIDEAGGFLSSSFFVRVSNVPAYIAEQINNYFLNIGQV